MSKFGPSQSQSEYNYESRWVQLFGFNIYLEIETLPCFQLQPHLGQLMRLRHLHPGKGRNSAGCLSAKAYRTCIFNDLVCPGFDGKKEKIKKYYIKQH